MNKGRAWVIKKDNIFYQNILNIGLKTHYHYSEDIDNAKRFEKILEADRVCSILNKIHKQGCTVVEYDTYR